MKSAGGKSGILGSNGSAPRAPNVVLGFAVLAYVFAGCTASDPSKQASTPMHDDPSKGIICTYTVPTGSALKEKKCTTPEQREQQRRENDVQIQIQSTTP